MGVKEKMIKGKDIDEVLYKVCKKFKTAPEYSPRRQKTKELIQETLVIKDPSKCVVTNPARKISRDYLDKELKWYLSGDKNIKEIGKHASMWNNIADENGKVNSNYGEIVFFQELENYTESQFCWVIESLCNDQDSRQAIINFNQPKHKKEDVKDFVCCISVQYLIRDKKLISITNMRSSDLIYGFCNDFPFFAYLQQELLRRLNRGGLKLKLGMNIHTAGSLHIYEKHFPMIDKIIDEYEKGDVVSEELDVV